MIKIFLFILISTVFLFAETFQERQNTLQDIKNIVQYEESFAKAYEEYILNNYKLPTITQINTLLDGNRKDFVSVDNKDKVNSATLTQGLTKLNYALSNDLADFKSLYESNTFRKKTYVRDNAVYFILENVFAKHLFDLIYLNNNVNKEIKQCTTTNSDRACIYNDHIYIDATFTASTITGYLMCYHIGNFEAGPIIISTITSDSIFKSIPKGVLIYDTNGKKYIKTTSGVMELK